MTKFTFYFHGRPVGALGLTETFEVSYEALDWKDAERMLYEDYEHIRFIGRWSN